MNLDTESLRVAFAVVALTLAVLFYFADFRSTRSPYSAWWCVSLALFLAGSATFLLEETPYRWLANPLGNALLVGGAAAIWASARSLRAVPATGWMLAGGPAFSALAAAMDSPATNPFAGDLVFLVMMSLMLGLAARELALGGSEVSRLRKSTAIAAAAVSSFYLCRLLAFIIDGPRGSWYNTYVGSAPTTLMGMAFLSVASFSMFALSSENQTKILRTAAAQDGLTGLLNRAGFLDAAGDRLRVDGNHGALVLADLDHFKSINDNHGHAAGDTALKAFAGACRAAVRSGDLAGRMGGEEFVLLLPGVSALKAQAIAADISDRFEAAGAGAGFTMPTVSYGIIPIEEDAADLEQLIAAADIALYMAKSLGRNRSIIGASYT
ncbi:GGDEF domain-containing protein [Arthrobacter sp. NPDC080073]|uniref:GGDEF domain-containing protein n=1 Tax=Arthrobacter sp. NPDC080073 TaxID=3155919 RepID=UPI003449D21E